MNVRRFHIEVPDADIADLHRRIDSCRWPDEINDDNWSWGTRLSYLRQLVEYWREGFNWREVERDINQLDHFMLPIDGLDQHFIHQRSAHPDAVPIILSHGWPGSFIEFLELIPRLTDPVRFGGTPADAFHVIVPSHPGYGFSEAPRIPGMDPRNVAGRYARLMATLGYSRYIAQGGDWGCVVARILADMDSVHCAAIHLNYVPADPPPDSGDAVASLTASERAALEHHKRILSEGYGYYHIQRTRPQTLAYGLTDSPVGMCAWITEKFQSWSDCGGEIRNAMSWDALLSNISLYWYTGSIASSVRMYKEIAMALRRGEFNLLRNEVPTGAALYPGEMFRPPRAWVERQYNLVHWFEAPRGGHFAAMECPQIFAEDLWRFKRAILNHEPSYF